MKFLLKFYSFKVINIDHMINKIIFFMGRSASGKSTISKMLCDELRLENLNCVVVDADELAKYKLLPLFGDYSLKARLERAPHLVKLVKWLQSKFDYVIVAATGQPKGVREIFKKEFKNCITIYLSASLELCKSRDNKGIYEMKDVPGLDLPYDEPLDCNYVLEVDNLTPTMIIKNLKKIIFKDIV